MPCLLKRCFPLSTANNYIIIMFWFSGKGFITRISKQWCECIKKIYEADTLRCLNCDGDWRSMSLKEFKKACNLLHFWFNVASKENAISYHLLLFFRYEHNLFASLHDRNSAQADPILHV